MADHSFAPQDDDHNKARELSLSPHCSDTLIKSASERWADALILLVGIGLQSCPSKKIVPEASPDNDER